MSTVSVGGGGGALGGDGDDDGRGTRVRGVIAPLESQRAVRTREHAKPALVVHIAQERSGASDGYLALAHAPACAHRMHFRATRGLNLRTLAVRRFALRHG